MLAKEQFNIHFNNIYLELFYSPISKRFDFGLTIGKGFVDFNKRILSVISRKTVTKRPDFVMSMKNGVYQSDNDITKLIETFNEKFMKSSIPKTGKLSVIKNILEIFNCQIPIDIENLPEECAWLKDTTKPWFICKDVQLYDQFKRPTEIRVERQEFTDLLNCMCYLDAKKTGLSPDTFLMLKGFVLSGMISKIILEGQVKEARKFILEQDMLLFDKKILAFNEKPKLEKQIKEWENEIDRLRFNSRGFPSDCVNVFHAFE